MIQVTYTFSETLHDLVIKGHAEYNNGNDIVCAGVSAITYTLAGYLLNKRDAGASVELESGQGSLQCLRTPHTDIAIEMAMIGFCQIANTYPNNVSIHINAAPGC